MINPPFSSQGDGASAPARTRRKWLTFGALGLLAALALAAALVPTILSTAAGRNVVVGAINDSVRGSVTIDALSLSWLDGQSVRGLEILDPAGAKVGRLEELSTELTLLEVVQRKLSLGQTMIRGLTAELVVDEAGVNNLARALEPTQPSPEDAVPSVLPFTGNIKLADASVTVKTSKTEPVLFDGLAGAIQIEPTDRLLDVALEGRSRQSNKTGKFNIKGQISGLIAPDGALSPRTAKGNLQAIVEGLPIDSVDGMLGFQGLLSAAAGDAANLNIQASGTAEVQDLLIMADAPNVQAEFAAQVLNQERFILTRPASARLSVTPDLFQTLAAADRGEAALRLVEPFSLRVEADSLSLSISDFNLADVALRSSLQIDQPIRLTAPDLGEVTMRSLDAVVDTERVAETVSVQLDGEAESQNETGKLLVRATLEQMVDEAGALQLDKMRADVVVDLSSVPTLLVDQMARQDGRLVALLGPKMDLSAKAVSSGSDRIDAALTLDAGPLKATEVKLSLTDAIVLSAPAQIHYRMSPQVVRRVLGEELGYTLRQPAELVLEVQALSAPLPKAGEPIFQPAETKIQGSLTAERLAVSGVPGVNTLQVDGARFDLSADTLASIRLRGSAQVSEADSGVLTELSAAPLQLRVDADTGLDATGALGAIAARLQLTGKGVSNDVSLTAEPDLSRAALTAPGAVRLVLTPRLLQRLGVTSPDQATLSKPASLEVDLSRLDLPLAPFSWSEMQAEAAVRIDELTLAGKEPLAGAALRNADIAVDYNGPEGSASVKLAALTLPAVDQQPGTLKVDAMLGRLFRDGELSPGTADIDAQADIDALPTALLAALSGQAALVPIVGDAIKINARVNRAGGQGGAVELETQSRNLTAEAGFELADELALSRPASLGLTLTPAGYEALMAEPPASSGEDTAASGYALAEDARFETVITTLRWPLTARFDPSRAALTATAKAPRLSLRDRATGQTVSIEMFEMKLDGSDLSKPIDIELDGQIRDAQDGKAQPGEAAGRIGVSGQAADVFNKDGQFDADGLSLRLDGRLQALPTALLDELLGVDGMISATLGPTADIILDANVRRMAGPLNLELRSINAKADVKTQLSKDGLALTKPLLAEVQVTPAFGQLVLGKIHPIFETAQSSDRAVRFEVPREGTLIPIRDYDISKVVVPRMVLDLGTLTLKSGWLLKGVIGLAQQLGRLEASGVDRWTAQFTPAVLKMSGGIATYERRLDLLLDERMHLATWGTADIATDRADLTLAFMPETLQKVFGLKVAPNDALRIPLRGALSGPNVDFAKAGLEIERLRQQQRLAKKDPLVGALVGAVATAAIGVGPVPPPSVVPLPWGPLPVPAGQLEAPQTAEPTQPSDPAAPKSLEQQAIEGLMGILKKKKE